MSKINWDKNQKLIFREIMTSPSNISIKATAGSGKSTVLVELANLLPPSLTSIFVAFNNKTVNELRERLPNKFKTSTLHSLGLEIIKNNFGTGVVLSGGKVYNFAQKLIGTNKEIKTKEKNSRIYYAKEGYNYLRSTMTDINDMSAVENMLERFGLSSNYGYEDLYNLDKMIHKYDSKRRKRNEKFEIDFGDMIYLPVKLNLRVEKYDNVLLDECQDLNLSQHLLIDKIIKRSGRLISVGDKFQQIYLFAGSDKSSFDRFSLRDNTKELPLSVSYRCSKSVVNEAKKYNPTIVANPSAIEGFVGEAYLDEVKEGDAVLCRNNSPLFSAYLDFINDGKKAYIVGKDIAERFHSLIKPYLKSHLGALEKSLYRQLDNIESALSIKGVKSPEKHPKFQSFLDIAKSLFVLMESCSNMKDLVNKIDEVFCPQKNSIELSSIHKSKGLEYNNVFLLRRDMIPSKFAKTDEEIQQENHLMFVAITRAKSDFYYITVNKNED